MDGAHQIVSGWTHHHIDGNRYGEAPTVIVQFGANPLPGKRTTVKSTRPGVCEPCRRKRYGLGAGARYRDAYDRKGNADQRALDFTATSINIKMGDTGTDQTFGNRRSRRVKAKEISIEVTKEMTIKEVKVEVNFPLRTHGPHNLIDR